MRRTLTQPQAEAEFLRSRNKMLRQGLLWVSTFTLTRAPIRSKPYHLTGWTSGEGRDEVLLTSCGMAIAYEGAEHYMVQVAPKVAVLIARPCIECAWLLAGKPLPRWRRDMFEVVTQAPGAVT